MQDALANPAETSATAMATFPDLNAIVTTLTTPGGYAHSMRLPVIVWDTEFRISGWNQAAVHDFGWTVDEVVGRDISKFVGPIGYKRLKRLLLRLLATSLPIHSIHDTPTKMGKRLACEWQSVLLYAENGDQVIVSTAHNLTAHRRVRRVQEHIRALTAAVTSSNDSDHLFLLLREAILDVGDFDRVGIWRRDGDTLLGVWGTDETGNLRDERAMRLPAERHMPFLRPLFEDKAEFVIRSNDIMMTPEGELFEPALPVDMVGIALRTRGQMVGVVFADHLLTGRRIVPADIEAILPFCEQAAMAIAETQLLIEQQRQRERRRKLEQTAAAISSSLKLDDTLRLVRDAIVNDGEFDRAGIFLLEDGVVRGSWGTDLEGGLRDERDTTLPEQEWADCITPFRMGEHRYFIVDTNTEPAIVGVAYRCGVMALRAGGELVGICFVDNRLSGRDFQAEEVERLLPIIDQAAVAIQNARLFQELQKAQDALVHSEKLRAIGELASGMAHNVNNALAAVLGYAELIQEIEDAPDAVLRYAATIEKAALDGAEIVRRVQRFARRETGQVKSVIDLTDTAGEALAFMRPAWEVNRSKQAGRIRCQTQLTPGVYVQAVPSEIREVIVNLIRNSVDAMNAGGTLRLRTCIEEGEAILQVEDTGTGMEEATRQRIFEPFFTTKEVGHGTGLGLSVAWGIIERHQGRIEVASRPGEGTIFTVRLPLVAPQAKEPDLTSLEGALQDRHFLIVDEHRMLVEGIGRLLRGCGARVTSIGDGYEALSWLKKSDAPCHVLIADQSVGVMSGLELLAQVAEAYPGIRRVLLSEWGADLAEVAEAEAAELILERSATAERIVQSLGDFLRVAPPHDPFVT